jgi:hypothetical protein
MCTCIPKLKECCKKLLYVAVTRHNNKSIKPPEKPIEIKVDERYYQRQQRFVVP